MNRALRCLHTPTFRDLGEEITKTTEKWPLAGRQHGHLICQNPRKEYFQNIGVTPLSNAVEESLMRIDS